MVVSVERLKPHPGNTEFFSDMTGWKWDKFLASIAESNGPIEPLIITEDYIVVSGNQRLRACKQLGIQSVQCEMRKYKSEEEIIKDLIEINVEQRGTIESTPEQMLARINALKKYYNIKKGCVGEVSKGEVYKLAGVSKDDESYAKAIVSAVPEARELLEEGVISKKAVWAILSKLPAEDQRRICQMMDAEGKYTVDMVAHLRDELKKRDEETERAKAEAEQAVSDSVEAQREAMRLQKEIDESKDSKRYVLMKEQRDQAQQEARTAYERQKQSETRLTKQLTEAQKLEQSARNQLKMRTDELEKARAEIAEKDKIIEETVLYEEVPPADYEETKQKLAEYEAQKKKREEELKKPGYIKLIMEFATNAELEAQQVLTEVPKLFRDGITEETRLEIVKKLDNTVKYIQGIQTQLVAS